MRQPHPDQGALFAPPDERRHAMDPHIYLPASPRPTQVEAASRALPRSGTQRARVLDAVSHGGDLGRTDEELAQVLGLSLNSVRPRRLELVEDGLVVDSGQTRPTVGGGQAIVWVAAEDAAR